MQTMVEIALGEYGAIPRGVIEHHETLVDGLLGDLRPIKPHPTFPLGNRFAGQRYQTDNWYATVAMIEGYDSTNNGLATFTSVTLKEAVPTEVVEGQTLYKVIQLNTFKVPLGQTAFISNRHESFGELHSDQVLLSKLFLPHATEMLEAEQDLEREAFIYSDPAHGDDPFHSIFIPPRRKLLVVQSTPNQEGQSTPASVHDIKQLDRVLGKIMPDDVIDRSGRPLRERIAVREDTAAISEHLQRLAALAQQRNIDPSWMTEYGQRLRILTNQKENGIRARRALSLRRQASQTPNAFQITDLPGVYEPVITREYRLRHFRDYGPSLVVAFPGVPGVNGTAAQWEVSAPRRSDLVSMFSRLR